MNGYRIGVCLLCELINNGYTAGYYATFRMKGYNIIDSSMGDLNTG